jgi:hypothetical protein
VLTPRKDLRIMTAEMTCGFDRDSPPGIMEHLSPSTVVNEHTRWSRMLVGRGIEKSFWPTDIRAEGFAFENIRLPPSFPPSLFPFVDDGERGRIGQCLASAGASSSTYSWINDLSVPLRSRGATFEAVRRYGNLSEADAVGMAEELIVLSDSYSTS